MKIASRIIEHTSRIRIALASCCPEAETFSLVALKLQPVWTISSGAIMPTEPRSIHPQRVHSVIIPINLPSWRAQNGRACLAKTRLQIMRPRA